MPTGIPKTGKRKHHKTNTPANTATAAQTASTANATATNSPAPVAEATTARNNKLPAPRPLPEGILLDEANRLTGIIVERQRLLDIAEGEYQRHLGRLVEHYRLDPGFAWHLSAGFMIPAETSTASSARAMAAGSSS